MKDEINENDVYWLSEDSAIMIHLSNKPTRERDCEGRLKDNIVNEGWFLFKGTPGNMKPIKKLSLIEVKRLLDNGGQ